MATEINSITFWLNAFIPNSVCLIKGNLFVLQVPFIKDDVPLPIPVFRFFSGDQREFSNDINESSRMHSEVRIEQISSESPIFFQKNICGESHETDEDGNVIASATASNERMRFLNLRGSQTVDPEGGVVDDIQKSVQIDLEGSANLPLIAFAPDIDYSGTLTIDRAEGNVLFKGAVSGFPSFEMYFSVNDGPPVILAQIVPNFPEELIGFENRPVNAVARIIP